jgi:hypothetical protein
VALQIKDETLLQNIAQLSRIRGVSKTDVLRTAIKNELEKETSKARVQDLLGPLLERVEALGPFKRMTPDDEKRLSDELWGQ